MENNYRRGIYVTTKVKKDIIIKVISKLLLQLDKEIEIRNNKYESFVKYPNGNLIRIALPSNTTVRGYRFNGMIIDSEIEKEIVDTTILPYLIPLITENGIYNGNDEPIDRMYYCAI